MATIIPPRPARNPSFVMVEVFGSSTSKTFSVDQGLLMTHSGNFRQLIESMSCGGTIKLFNVEPEIFDLFQQYLHNNDRIPAISDACIEFMERRKAGPNDLPIDSNDMPLALEIVNWDLEMVKLYCFAHKFEAFGFAEKILRAYHHALNSLGLHPFWDGIDHAFRMLPHKSALRTLLIDTVAARVEFYIKTKTLHRIPNPVFLHELIKRLAEIRPRTDESIQLPPIECYPPPQANQTNTSLRDLDRDSHQVRDEYRKPVSRPE